MSTLTKILIVLLSLFSLFLCGTIVTYVGTTKNYKNAYEDLKAELTVLQKKNKSYEQQLEEKKRQMDELASKLDSEIAKLKTEKTRLEQDLKNAERAKSALDEKVQNLAAAALKFEGTVGGMEESLKKQERILTRQGLKELSLPRI